MRYDLRVLHFKGQKAWSLGGPTGRTASYILFLTAVEQTIFDLVYGMTELYLHKEYL